LGGHGAGPTRTLLGANLARWLARATAVLHLDLHTGLGARGAARLLIDYPLDEDEAAVWVNQFEKLNGSVTVGLSATAGRQYAARGSLAGWCRALLPGVHYRFAFAEFGTYRSLVVLRALRDENQAHHWNDPNSPEVRRAKARLREVFCPADPAWRKSVIRAAIDLARRAYAPADSSH
jgi:hypothetical protein